NGSLAAAQPQSNLHRMRLDDPYGVIISQAGQPQTIGRECNEAALTLMGLELMNQPAGRQVPQTHRAVELTGCQKAAVGGKGERYDAWVAVGFFLRVRLAGKDKRPSKLAGWQVPQSHGLVPADADQGFAIGSEGDPAHHFVV